MNERFKSYFFRPQSLVAAILLIGLGIVAYTQYGKLESVPTSAAPVNILSWNILEPTTTVSTKIYRNTIGFLEDPDSQYLLATVSSPTNTYNDTAVSNGQTYYYSIFLLDDAGVEYDPSYYEMIPGQSTPSPSGGGGSGSGGGGGTRTPTTTPPVTTTGIRLVNAGGTFYLIQSGQRKGVTSPGIMYSCGFEFKDATTATSLDLALPASLLLPCGGALVKSVQDQTVYLISNGKRYAFTSANVFLGLGFKWTSVLLVSNPELQALPKASDLNDSSSAHLPNTDININGTIYWISPSLTKHPYTSLSTWNSWHKDGDFTTVVPANGNDIKLITGSAVGSR